MNDEELNDPELNLDLLAGLARTRIELLEWRREEIQVRIRKLRQSDELVRGGQADMCILKARLEEINDSLRFLNTLCRAIQKKEDHA